MMRIRPLAVFLSCAGLVSGFYFLDVGTGASMAQSPDERKMPDVLRLAEGSKLGAVTFSHTNHVTKNRNVEGTGPMACTECHHTEQPASEVSKHPPLKTAWPADRTQTLTADLLKEANAPGVISCRDCHARTGEKPKIWPEIPQIKSESGTAIITLNNQQAFHRNCAGCHDEVVKTRTGVNAPTSQKCVSCHKK
jgi:hypothetical protein